MQYQPAENLRNRTFVGLIVAQFLAGFNDQAIHASAMFYAMHKVLTQETAITLMPILFYAPWAIFCTYAGYFADRYSKTFTLRFWKWSEVAIATLLTAGFFFGTNTEFDKLGGWVVMSCVFLMGTHAAFFAPAKYGAMPEILMPHILSRGNGILESTTFLASILGTVSGGLLFDFFRGNEVWIGIILLVLSVIGALASSLIVWLPPADPTKPFPWNPITPLFENLRVMLRSRPLVLSVMGIAFFIFMVSYMRASMYMHGESRDPRWDEKTTSLVVATVALGVGLGSPLAGFLSGGKIELGLVPLGAVGMIIALIIAAVAIEV
ncbi:MAG TPA: MFS transporter, partial [Gemmataceae bacterium]|nr:MFS transporter [Gemmataceae bacterium]